ncbi:MAG: CPBP family intramembrane metalloprotease [Clostridiaceae bacterium]|nr:CPBP family intramembrane metalloprotease [Clostridiaceae bacterium]
MGFFKNRYNELWAGWKIAIVLVAFFVTTFIFTIVISFAYGILAVLTSGQTDPAALTQTLMNDDLFIALSGIMQNVAMIVVVIVFWKVFDKKPFADMGLSSFRQGSRDLVYGLVLGAVTISVVFVVFLLSGQIIVVNDFLNPNFSWALLIDLVLMIFVGFGEEMFSRGYCMSVLRRSNVFLIFIVPNLIFALLHISNQHFSFLPLINIFLVGALFSLMFFRRGNIWMPIGYHITWNYFQGSVFGLPVSGNDLNGLYTSKLLSENIFNGGGFGPEGGLLVTFVMVISIALFYLLSRKKATETTTELPM